MTGALTRAQLRELDRRAVADYGIPGLLLMEHAGLGLCREALAFLAELGAPAESPMTIVCGRGNNGGDGFVLARLASEAGYAVRIAYLADLNTAPAAEDAATNFEIVRRLALPLLAAPDPQRLAAILAEPSALIVDAYLGTGLEGELRPSARGFVEALNAQPAPVLAVDIPSGLDCDTGEALGAAVRARRTITMAAPKVGFERSAAGPFIGDVRVVSIGAPKALLSSFLSES